MPGAGRSLFITGAGGFLGRALLDALGPGQKLKLLLRDPKKLAGAAADATIVTGDLCDPRSYRDALEGVDTVIHMAALTGKVSGAQIAATNVRGTARLLEACKAAGVRNFLFVSSIAAGYPNKRFYPYAASKQEGEAMVRASGLNHAIVRPTLVLGQGSPIWATLAKIASLPVIPLPGGGAHGVQPVDVADVARGLALVVRAGRFDGETFELGGRDAMSMRAFLGAIHKELTGSEARFLPMPLGPIRLALALAEPALRSVLPATAGQLALFANPSVAQPNWLMEQLAHSMPSTEELLARMNREGASTGAGPGSAQAPAPERGARPDRQARDEDPAVLAAECAVFARYLTGRPPEARATDHYIRALRARGLAEKPPGRFDRLTLRVARSGRLGLWLADSHCALLHRRGMLRRRLILMLAIVEHAPESHQTFDRTPDHGPVRAIALLSLHALAGAGGMALGVLLFLPAQLGLGLAGGLAGGRRGR